MRLVILGLSITSSWGNGHATTFRGLVRGLTELGHDVLFLERDVPWYAENRDLPEPPYGRTELYSSVSDLKNRFTAEIREGDAVVVGSYVPEGVEVGDWAVSTAGGPVAFYDIDTPVTLAKLDAGDEEYITRGLIGRYGVYLSFTGGPLLEKLVSQYGARGARPLYCSFDPDLYYPEPQPQKWDMGYLGTYSDDRQPKLESMMLEAARQWGLGRFVVAGPQYPEAIRWPANVDRLEHVAPADHRSFYCAQRFTLNVTREAMTRVGYCPSVRLFEAAACAAPIISDEWQGLETVLEPGREILISSSASRTLEFLMDLPETDRAAIGERARARVMTEHTSLRRAAQLETYITELAAMDARGRAECWS